MKEGVYAVLRAKFLVSKNALSNWGYILMAVFFSMLMIANIHYFESKLTRIVRLQAELKEYRSEFVDVRSQLMRLKMESSVSEKMELLEVYPSQVPPVKIKVKKTLE